MRRGGRPMAPQSTSGMSGVSDETLGYIFAHLDNPADRRAVSQVCLQWKQVDAHTRKHVQIENCYSVAPGTLSTRFPNLISLKVKGKPRSAEFGLLPPNWTGYYAAPWVEEVARAYAQKFESLWLRRMNVTDDDLKTLAYSCPQSLLSLKLDKCSGFSAVGIAYITRNCRSLKVLYMEECAIVESDSTGEWLHELAENNPNLEELNFQYTTGAGLYDIELADLEALAVNCKSLRSLKVSEVDVLDVGSVLSRVPTLLELGTGCCRQIGESESPPPIIFPRSITTLSGLYELIDTSLPMISSMLANLKNLDLQYSLLTQDGYSELLRHCTRLEVLAVRNGLGDAGLITVARTCKNLRRLRIDDSAGEGFLSPAGIIPLAQNCVRLEFLVMYVSDLSNATLAAIAENCSVLRDCRFVLLPVLKVIPDLPLDEGVKSLLKGCKKLTRFALYVRHGALTDRGMAYIGEFGSKLKWILLGCTGESDLGLSKLASGCHSLQKLEMRDCPVTESGLAAAAFTLRNSLKFLWVQGYHSTEAGGRLLARSRPFWVVEAAASVQLLMAYCSLAEPRKDYPPELNVLSGLNNKPLHDNGGDIFSTSEWY